MWFVGAIITCVGEVVNHGYLQIFHNSPSIFYQFCPVYTRAQWWSQNVKYISDISISRKAEAMDVCVLFEQPVVFIDFRHDTTGIYNGYLLSW